jgi:catechol 2,3-dioxygenase-like lactoylglutathione lyase family enzyme
MLKGLGHIGLFVKNVELSKKFYVSLGFEPTASICGQTVQTSRS